MMSAMVTQWARARVREYRIATVLITLVVVLVFAFRKGQDINPDQRNYHVAVPFLLLHGTFWDSVMPAGIQSYFNPLPLIPQYLAIRHLPPLIVTGLIGLAQAPIFLICAAMCRRIAGPDDPGTGRGYVRAFLGFLLCLGSPIALAEAGTTFVDLLTAVPVVGAYALLLEPRSSRSFVAGLLLGCATGLKLTNACFVAGSLCLCGTAEVPAARRIQLTMLVAIGVGCGFLLSAGYWHWQLWERFGNPIYPFFNNLFAHAPVVSVGRDKRFLPRSALAAVTYPFYWLLGGSPKPGLLSPASEADPRDARYVITLIGFVAAAVLGRRRLRSLRGAERGLLLGWVAGYIIWLFGFCIERYAIPIEMLAGAVILCLVKLLPRPRDQSVALGAACVVSLIVLHVPSAARMRWGNHWQTIAADPLRLQGRPLVFLTETPSAFIVASLTPPARLVNLDGEFPLGANSGPYLGDAVAEQLTVPETQAYVVDNGLVPEPAATMLRSYGLERSRDCQKVQLPLAPKEICRLIGIAGPTEPAQPMRLLHSRN
jgi:hypothetical protein